jgi:hypothetical protein
VPRPHSFALAIELVAILAQRLAGGSHDPVVRRNPDAKAAARIVVMKALFLRIECWNIRHDFVPRPDAAEPHRQPIARRAVAISDILDVKKTRAYGASVMKLPRRRFLHVAMGAAVLPAVSRMARAQTYPARPVRAFAA